MIKVCVIGLGYVGLPILLRLSTKYNCIGFDNNTKRIKDLKKGKDIFNEFQKKDLKKRSVKFSNLIEDVMNSNIYIVTVPTPIYQNKKPDLSHLKDVCLNLSKIIKKDDIIIFESTVYPGLTNDYCIPILEKSNKLKEGEDFFVGYSPERVNPGDKNHDIKKINKILAYPYKFKKNDIVSIYTLISKKLVFSKNIKEAETAKVIENIQRDVNIGLINEIYLVCKKMKINFNEVMNLASSKWNFLKFDPGLVGGHCLPVDPYYFSYISKKNKINTRITLAGRFINDSMAKIIRNQIKKEINKINPKNKKKILICGITYKKNVADLRNSLPLKIFKQLNKNNSKIKGFDPLIDKEHAKKNKLIYDIKSFFNFDIYVVLTKHRVLLNLLKKLKKNKIIISPI